MPNGIKVIKKVWKCILFWLWNLHFGQVSFQTMYFQTHESLCFQNYFNFHLGIGATHRSISQPLQHMSPEFPSRRNRSQQLRMNVAHPWETAEGRQSLLYCNAWLRDAGVRILVNIFSLNAVFYTYPHWGFSAVFLPTHTAWEVLLQCVPVTSALLNLKELGINYGRGEIPVISPPDHFHKNCVYFQSFFICSRHEKYEFLQGQEVVWVKQKHWVRQQGGWGLQNPAQCHPIFPVF